MTEVHDYEDARGSALTLPAWILRIWERRATSRLGRGAPTGSERARLLAVRSELRQREQEWER